MKKLCIIFRTAPHGNPQGREALDLAMLCASFEQEVSLVFTDEGVLHLLPNQMPELIKAKDYISTFRALPLYDIDHVLVCHDALTEFGINQTPLNIDNALIVGKELISAQLQQADEVLVF